MASRITSVGLLLSKNVREKIGHEFDGLASIVGDKNLTNASLAILGVGKVPRLAS